MADAEASRKREEQLVVFQLAGQTYGMDIARVFEIIRMETITRVPKAPSFVEGVIKLRGNIIPVIDLRKRFAMPPAESTANNRIVIVEMGGTTIGMIVDAVSEVLRISQADIEPPPPMVAGVDAAYLRGIALWRDRLIILLDLEKILAEKEQARLRQARMELAAEKPA
ncbi:chemotaxis protein CheW [Candidatus Desulforudis audaxviator]|uniref:Chemotaxis protein CheW n=1 Tax=Desulforudis audaxviator (strain MP104C) TaxID=477974 RepID=B1I5I1_DESAP|nr:chemotaxis protein CheW [Candidatus Desulforudis audaxviator]ACA60289.1 putative CheW protein [Candidatus Desulforudis audaxviator MP104C]AZK60336.1 Positive regulator of CheA protein activity (CheW) [Candidatus Desulforudis audaxviator]